jgi:alpha-tubulin suppressor-like RCC1 family protein
MGKLGHGNTQDYSEPTMIVSLLNYRIFDISCGSQHTVTVGILREMTKSKTNTDDIKTKDNYLFLFGDNTFGQIGLEAESYIDTPKLLDFFLVYKIKKIECGFFHNVILTGISIIHHRMWKGFCIWGK